MAVLLIRGVLSIATTRIMPLHIGKGWTILWLRSRGHILQDFASAIDTFMVLVIALGAGLGAWGDINLLKGYSNDNPGANAHVR